MRNSGRTRFQLLQCLNSDKRNIVFLVPADLMAGYAASLVSSLNEQYGLNWIPYGRHSWVRNGQRFRILTTESLRTSSLKGLRPARI